jgi:hypothetical protein
MPGGATIGQAPAVLAVVEIVPDPPEGTLTTLVRDAYFASQRGVIILVLNGVSPGQVDDALDPIVRLLPLSIPGLRYLDISDRTAVEDAVARTVDVRSQTTVLAEMAKGANGGTQWPPRARERRRELDPAS